MPTVLLDYSLLMTSLSQVPKPAGSEEVGTVQLRISNGQYFSAREEKQVLIRKAGTGTLIQMEKPVYKPGQTGEHSA